MDMGNRGNKPQSRMRAQHDDPWIGVHVLTEFIFCPRAGLIAYEQQSETEEEELPLPQLGYRAGALLWSVRQIKTQLIRQLAQLWLWLAVTTGLFVAAASMFDNRLVAIPLYVAAAVAGLVTLKRVFRVLKLALLRLRAAAATPRTPNPASNDNQDVDWWSLLNAGFESIPYKEILRDSRWRCAGKPWRVLRHGSLRIPVFRLKGGTKKLYRQHYARMAAYCHLLETCEGAESPYGVILMPGRYTGVTVPNNPASSKAFHQGLLAARSTIKSSEHRDPSAPDNRQLCNNCKIGRPGVYREGVTTTTCNGRDLPVYYFEGGDGRPYHSPCGDRYRWYPPHARFYEKRG